MDFKAYKLALLALDRTGAAYIVQQPYITNPHVAIQYGSLNMCSAFCVQEDSETVL